MSIDQAKALIERMKSDKAFADQVMAIEDFDKRMSFIKKAGFDFTVEEIRAVKAEISDDQVKWALCSSSCAAVHSTCNGPYA